MSRPPDPSPTLFSERFDAAPTATAFAPGRVNLIGEHTDYNDGFVFPLAIQFGVRVAGRLTDSGRVVAYSANFPADVVDFAVGLQPQGADWGHFLRAIVAELSAVGIRPTGLELAFVGDVPPGAGLSSSAAFSVAAAMLVAELVGRPWPDPVALARLCQAAEHRTGVMCGLLDQMASAACRAGAAMLLDCRSLARRMIPIDREQLAVIVGDTRVQRELSDGRYNQRRVECEAAADAFGVKALRDVTLEDLAARRGEIPEMLWRRARHVVNENNRVHTYATALEADDMVSVGRLTDASHAGLRDDFEVSCPELDAMAAAFREAGAYGARLVGAGFGGAAIAVVDPAKTDAIIADARAAYQAATGLDGAFHVVYPGDGARVTLL